MHQNVAPYVSDYDEIEFDIDDLSGVFVMSANRNPRTAVVFVRCTKDMHEALAAVADREECTVSAVVRRALKEHVNKRLPARDQQPMAVAV